jgi:hypothetical protein
MENVASIFASLSLADALSLMGVIVGLAGIVPAVLILRVSQNRRELLLSIISRSRLFAPEVSQPVHERLKSLFDPSFRDGNLHLVAIELTNIKKKSIGSDEFDGRRGIRVECGVPVVMVLEPECEPTSAQCPTVNPTSSGFEILPELITGGEVIRVSLITDGRVEDLKVQFNPLRDIQIQTQDREAWEARRRQRRRRTAVLAGGLAAALVAGVAILASYAAFQENASLSSARRTNAVAVCEEIQMNLMSMIGGLGNTQPSGAKRPPGWGFGISLAAYSQISSLANSYGNLSADGISLSPYSRRLLTDALAVRNDFSATRGSTPANPNGDLSRLESDLNNWPGLEIALDGPSECYSR